MKNTFSAWIAVLVGLAASAVGQPVGNAPSRGYVTIDYQKPLPGKGGDYVRMEREYWKPIHQARVSAGNIVSWKLYVVNFPNGEGQEYDYVTVTEFPSWAALENPYGGINYTAILGEAKVQEMRTVTGATRKLVRRDTLNLAFATENFSKAENRYMSVHYIKALPGRAADFMKVQSDYYLPMNSALAKANGGASAWAAAVVRYPDNQDFAYTHVSFNGHKSLAQMEAARPAELVREWDAKYTAVSALQQESRKRVHNELWRLVDQTQPK